MSERLERMNEAFRALCDKRYETRASISAADESLLEIVAAELDSMLSNKAHTTSQSISMADGSSIVGAVADGAVFAGILIGKMEADDTGYLFGRMTESICGTVMAPSFLGIEALLTGLRKMWAEGWRLVPPKTYGKQPKTVEEMTEYLSLKQLDEAYRRLYAGVVGRPGIAGALQVQPENLPEESK